MCHLYTGNDCYLPTNFLCTENDLYRLQFDDTEPLHIVGGSAYGGHAIFLATFGELLFVDLDHADQLLEA